MSAKKQTSLIQFFGITTPRKPSIPILPSTPKSSKQGVNRLGENSQKSKDKDKDKERKRTPSFNAKRTIGVVDDTSDTENQPQLKRSRNALLFSSSDDDDDITDDQLSSITLPVKKYIDEIITPKSKKKDLKESPSGSNKNKQKIVTKQTGGGDDLRTECLTSKKLPHQLMIERKEKNINGDDDDVDLVPGVHEKLDFLQPDKIRDKNRRRPNDPQYDPKTLHVPLEYLKKLTPCMRQWWEIKSDHFDCILFFKVGKFYELYHMDAVVGVKQLGFSYMKGSTFAHSGFPESSYGRMAASLVDAGYKVARVEQTETPDMLAERNLQNKQKDKVVKREVCQVTTKGTKVFGVHDIQANGVGDADANYLLAIIEIINNTTDNNNYNISYGICLVETSIGKFQLGQFNDDIHRSNLLLLLTHYPPGLILYPKFQLSDKTLNIFKTMLASTVKKEALIPDKQFLSAVDTMHFINEHKYFDEIPDIILKSSVSSQQLALSSFGAVCWYLNYSKLDNQLLSMNNINAYQIPASKTSTHLILDAITINHLRIFDKNKGLYTKLNLCKTAFGKRLLREWMTSPICSITVINDRLNAIDDLINNCGVNFIKHIQQSFKKIPDLERMLTRINTLGNLKQQTSHPDSRAIFFNKSYSKNNIIDFCKILNSFENIINNILDKINMETNSVLLKRLTLHLNDDGGGLYPNYIHYLTKLKLMFNYEYALKNGVIIPPSSGYDTDYDQILIDIDVINTDLEAYRVKQSKLLKCNVTYFGNDKKRYQLQIQEAKKGKKYTVPNEYQLESATKSVSRYSTQTTRALLSNMMQAENKKDKIIQKYTRKVFETFSKNNEQWVQAIQCIAYLDILFAFASYSNADNMCKPLILEGNNDVDPFINIIGARHACIANDDFIPNDINIGINDVASLILLTGPNMGGKSTLMRTVALITIIGQLGCYVPANKCTYTIVDRIFTRIGARDDIELGQSTFYVELEETFSILKYATRYSLALLDELGRGTSTYDGMSIADGVTTYLAECKLRTISSTHYHQLIDKYINDEYFNKIITLQHMSCFVDNDLNSSHINNHNKIIINHIIYLYKLTFGPCPKSFGFNVAHLAQLPNSIIKRGMHIAHLFETEGRFIRYFDKKLLI